MGVFNELYSGHANFSAVNTSWLCLIPKKRVISTARDLRPISLVHILSKIMSKVLATRLQKCLHLLINPHQAAFVKGRSILDNFLCAQFLVHHLHATKTEAAVLKIDFERAFDHINWAFVKETLAARGFGAFWIGWIDILLKSASAVVILNGTPGNSFNCERGLRQGDPLSPLLFILCVDVLYRMLQAAVTSDLLPGVGVGDLRFHTLQYADDLLLFFDGSMRSAAVIKLILENFSSCSGLQVNFDKSSIVSINLPSEQTTALRSFFNCPSQDFPLNYLGLPLSPRKLRKADYLPLIEKLDRRLANW